MYHHSTWVEPGKEKDKSAYKFPHHYADGKNTLSPRGVAAAMAALMGARAERWGGPHFPGVNEEAARRGIYKHLAEHYKRDLQREPPPLRGVGGREQLKEEKRRRLPSRSNPWSEEERREHQSARRLAAPVIDLLQGDLKDCKEDLRTANELLERGPLPSGWRHRNNPRGKSAQRAKREEAKYNAILDEMYPNIEEDLDFERDTVTSVVEKALTDGLIPHYEGSAFYEHVANWTSLPRGQTPEDAHPEKYRRR